MYRSAETISVLQATMILISSAGIIDHVIVIPMILQSAGRDSWLSVLFAGLIFIGWIFLIYSIIKNMERQHLLLWLKERVGTIMSWTIIVILSIHLFSIATLTLRDTTYWSNISYLPKTPNLLIVILFALVTFYAAFSGIRTIAIINGILLPFVILFGFFVAFSNMPNKDYSMLFPVFEHGPKPILKGMAYAGSGLEEFILFVLIQHRIGSKIRPLPLFITGIIFVNLMLSPLTGAIAEFGPIEAARQRFPAFEEWRIVTFGHYLEHVDFLSIYQWLVGSLIRISVAMYLIPELIKVSSGRRRTKLLLFLFLLMIGITQIPLSDMQFFQFLKTVFLPFSLVLNAVLSLVMGVLIILRKKEGSVLK